MKFSIRTSLICIAVVALLVATFFTKYEHSISLNIEDSKGVLEEGDVINVVHSKNLMAFNSPSFLATDCVVTSVSEVDGRQLVKFRLNGISKFDLWRTGNENLKVVRAIR